MLRRRLVVMVVCALALLVPCDATFAATLIGNFPRTLVGEVWTGQGQHCGNFAPGRVLSASQARPGFGPTIGPSFYGDVGWRIYQNGRNSGQCPLESTDHGRTWRVARWVLATDWAGGSSYFVSHLTMVSPRVVLAWGASSLDVTSDAGRTWYNVIVPEEQVALTGLVASNNLATGIRLVAGAWPDPLTAIPRATYRPLNTSYTRWTLVAQTS